MAPSARTGRCTRELSGTKPLPGWYPGLCQLQGAPGPLWHPGLCVWFEVKLGSTCAPSSNIAPPHPDLAPADGPTAFKEEFHSRDVPNKRYTLRRHVNRARTAEALDLCTRPWISAPGCPHIPGCPQIPGCPHIPGWPACSQAQVYCVLVHVPPRAPILRPCPRTTFCLWLHASGLPSPPPRPGLTHFPCFLNLFPWAPPMFTFFVFSPMPHLPPLPCLF